MNVTTSLILIACLFGFTFASGFWMWNTRKPVPGLKLNLHKFLALGALALSGLLVNALTRQTRPGGAALGVIAAAGALFVLTIVTGGLVSLEKPMPAAVRWAHRARPFLTLAAEAAAFWLLLG